MYGMSGVETERFYDGYVDAMMWANTYGEDHNGDVIPADAYTESRGLTVSAEESLRQDVADFLDDHTERLIRAAVRRKHGYTFESAGHDYALTRNGHGTGFWDRGLGMVGDALDAIARPYGERNLWINADGRVEVE